MVIKVYSRRDHTLRVVMVAKEMVFTVINPKQNILMCSHPQTGSKLNLNM